MTRSDLLTRIRTSRDELDRTLSLFADAEMVRRPPDGGWSAKDHLAHLDAWHRILLAMLAGEGGMALGLPRAEFAALSLDDMNRIIAERNRDRELADVRAEFERSFQDVVAAVEAMTDADLDAPVAADDPRPRAEKVTGDTWNHYDEHRPLIAALRPEPG